MIYPYSEWGKFLLARCDDHPGAWHVSWTDIVFYLFSTHKLDLWPTVRHRYVKMGWYRGQEKWTLSLSLSLSLSLPLSLSPLFFLPTSSRTGRPSCWGVCPPRRSCRGPGTAWRWRTSFGGRSTARPTCCGAASGGCAGSRTRRPGCSPRSKSWPAAKCWPINAEKAHLYLCLIYSF